MTDAEVKLRCNRATCLVALGQPWEALEEVEQALRL